MNENEFKNYYQILGIDKSLIDYVIYDKKKDGKYENKLRNEASKDKKIKEAYEICKNKLCKKYEDRIFKLEKESKLKIGMIERGIENNTDLLKKSKLIGEKESFEESVKYEVKEIKEQFNKRLAEIKEAYEALKTDGARKLYDDQLKEKELDFEKIDEVCHYIPSGKNVWEGREERFDLEQLRCRRNLNNTKRLERSLGTLGGGNHFIEIDQASDGTYYLVIHSGSRNLGKQVAEYYQQLAVDLHMGKEKYFAKRDEIIKTYKAAGRGKEIQHTLKELKKSYKTKVLSVPEDLCWLYGRFLEDYLHDVEICQAFARRNRERMAEIILEKTGMSTEESFHTIHNYIDTEEMILRKGAIAARKGEKVLIPVNMRDGSILAIGKGNKEWNDSAPHGAGRLMSRTRAKEQLDMETYKEVMKEVYTTSVNEQTLDEAPMAYKSLEDIIDVVSESVDVVEVMKPVFNFKAS